MADDLTGSTGQGEATTKASPGTTAEESSERPAQPLAGDDRRQVRPPDLLRRGADRLQPRASAHLPDRGKRGSDPDAGGAVADRRARADGRARDAGLRPLDRLDGRPRRRRGDRAHGHHHVGLAARRSSWCSCIGVAAGLANGFLVAFLGGNSFIMTLGDGHDPDRASSTRSPARRRSSRASQRGFVKIGAELVPRAQQPGLDRRRRRADPVWVLLDATELGRYMYAIGGNQEAARLSGIRTRSFRMIGFVIVGVAAAIVGILLDLAPASLHAERRRSTSCCPPTPASSSAPRASGPASSTCPGTVVGVLFLGDDPDRPDAAQPRRRT